MASADWTAVVLTGGTSSRLGGTDKTAVDLVDGRTSLDLILEALPDGVPAVVVGPAVPTDRATVFCREEPPLGGPVAALAAAMLLVRTPTVVLLAGDQPFAAQVAAMLAEEFDPAASDALVPLDVDGRRQPLCAAYSAVALRSAIEELGEVDGVSVRTLLERLRVAERPLTSDDAAHLLDIDTAEDLAAARRLARGH